ncbi:hypothetical protein P7K49_028973 [Saguinus oedipus]|uniref:Uncharacterized protein n=1 Tax=Saguinus oedipus TaxID=9490 RepID=A0ABQ9U6R3_SAGOE|nr:hypothetical protein P7K49_028973 [Saguinus oedipus]
MIEPCSLDIRSSIESLLDKFLTLPMADEEHVPQFCRSKSHEGAVSWTLPFFCRALYIPPRSPTTDTKNVPVPQSPSQISQIQDLISETMPEGLGMLFSPNTNYKDHKEWHILSDGIKNGTDNSGTSELS